jgi:2',3'-cyclic-nucleotide 2'-phosphodiesterase (5'-nucleotidase family)
MTGAQIKAVLEQQYRVSGAGVASTLSINVSEGFTYTWTAGNAAGSKVSDMRLNGVPLSMDQTYRVGTLSFLAQGGDGFSVFTQGTNLTGGPEDLKNLVFFWPTGAHRPTSRVDGLDQDSRGRTPSGCGPRIP